MYSLVDFGSMLTDNVRVQAYHKALEEVAGGKRVLEIGGGTGFFACLASAAGAEHVTSIETNSLITQGPALARSNGLTNIKFAMGSAQHYQADEPFDVIIHDLRGNTPFFEGSMATIRDARRLLKPGGRFLPQRDRVFAALVDDEVAFRRMEGVWGQRLAGLDLTALRAATHRRLRYEPSENATHWEPQLIADVSYIDPKEDAVDSTVTFAPDHDGVCHGVALWFETELTDNVGYTTNPWAPSQNRGTTYGVCFLPWARPIEIKEGESYRLEVGLSSKGQARCKISQNLGGSDLLLGMFEETYSAYKDIQIFTNSRFIANPLLKAYRVAMQGVEKGNSSAAIAKKLQQSCDNIPSEEAAYKLLAKVAQFTQVRVARGREKTTHLRFNDHPIRLVTNSKAVLDEVLAKLSPSWKPTRSAASEPLQVELREVFTAEGFAYNLNIDGSGFHYPIISEALDQLEIQVLLRGVLKSKTYLHLATSYSLTDRRGARISLSASDRASVCLLDKDFQVVPYATSGRQVEHSTPVPVQEIEVEGQASKALLVSLLVQRCQNVDAVENPLRYFAKLIDSVERVPVGGR